MGGRGSGSGGGAGGKAARGGGSQAGAEGLRDKILSGGGISVTTKDGDLGDAIKSVNKDFVSKRDKEGFSYKIVADRYGDLYLQRTLTIGNSTRVVSQAGGAPRVSFKRTTPWDSPQTTYQFSKHS